VLGSAVHQARHCDSLRLSPSTTSDCSPVTGDATVLAPLLPRAPFVHTASGFQMPRSQTNDPLAGLRRFREPRPRVSATSAAEVRCFRHQANGGRTALRSSQPSLSEVLQSVRGGAGRAKTPSPLVHSNRNPFEYVDSTVALAGSPSTLTGIAERQRNGGELAFPACGCEVARSKCIFRGWKSNENEPAE